MVLVTAFTTIAQLALTQSLDRLEQTARFQEQDLQVAAGEPGYRRALGAALALLATGRPSRNTYTCRLRLRSAAGEVVSYKAKFRRKSSGQWQVIAEPGGGGTPDCPAAFGGQCS
ncbi:MAG: hypothetical protein D6815_10045 [Candidatus Dadabacteria bacterium]|nr:MAG: hypothetical protein D6815_10045 [Candidatus Dadabacteria bacterium]